MITIEITEEVHNLEDMVIMLEEVIRRINRGARASYNPDYQITGEEEPNNYEEI